MTRTGWLLSALYAALATYIFLQFRAAPRTMGIGFASVIVVRPAVPTATLLGVDFDASNTSHMVWAILYRAALCYLLGWFIAKVVTNLTRSQPPR